MIEPSSYRSSRLMQRSKVVLPLPEAPITTTASPRCTAMSMPSSTRLAPNDFLSARMRTSGSPITVALFADVGEARLEAAARQGEGEVDGEIHQRSQHVKRHRLEGAADDLLDRQHEIDDADQRDQRATLDGVDHRVDPRRQEAPERLWEDDIGHALAEGEADRLAGLRLAGMDRLQGAARDLEHVRGLERRQRPDGGPEIVDVPAAQRQRVIDEEDEDEQRDAAQAVAVEADRPIDPARPVGQADAQGDAEDEGDDDDQRRDTHGNEKPAPHETYALPRHLHP